MVAHPEDRVAMALHLELGGGRRGASALVTMRERARILVRAGMGSRGGLTAYSL